VVASFGSGGTAVNAFGQQSPPSSDGEGVAVDANGDIYQAGEANASDGSSELYIARYLPGGSLDPSFGTGGVVYENVGDGSTPQTATFGSAAQATTDVALTAAGEPVVYTVATTSDGTHTQAAVLEFTQSGQLDTAFNSTGVYKFNLGTNTLPGGLVVQPNGDIVLTGAVEGASSTEFFAERLNGDGTLNTNFGSGGVTELQLDAGNTSWGSGVILQSNGDLVFSGTATDASNHQEFAIVRLTPTGQLDTGFGSGGVGVAQPSAASPPAAQGLAVTATPDGGYAVAGEAQESSSTEAAVARFDSSGQIDTAFGSGGIFIIDTPSVAFGDANGIESQADGKLLVTGTGLNAPSTAAGPFVARVNASGSLDSSFGSAGVNVNLIPGSSYAYQLSAVETPQGQLLLSGVTVPTHTSFLQEVSLDTPPTLELAYSPTSVTVGTPVQFVASAVPGDGQTITQVSWDFGGGSFGAATGSTVSHTFTAPGSYTVRAEATDSFGLSTISTLRITVVAASQGSGPPPGTTGVPSLTLVSVKPADHGASATLECKVAACDVGAMLTTVEHLRHGKIRSLSSDGHGKHTRLVTIGSASFTIKAGATETVVLHLNATGRRLLRRFHSIPATASFELTNGGSTMLRRTVRIH
jgi:uncharacterized delta-60 repeat protein